MEKIVARNEEKCNQALKPQKEEIKWWNRGERKKKKKNFTIKRNRKKRKENTRVRDATEREKKQKILQFGERTGWKSSSQDNIFFLEKLVSKKQLLLGYRNCYERGTRVAMENRWWTSVNSLPLVLSPPTESLSRSSPFHSGFRASGCNHRKLWRVLRHDSNGHRDPSAIALYNALHPSGEYVLTTCR